jgi:hypothetical protein
VRRQRPPSEILFRLPEELHRKLLDELVDELLPGAKTEDEIVGPGPLAGGLVVVRTPRDRDGAFGPRIARKRQPRFTGFDDLAFDSQGPSTEEPMMRSSPSRSIRAAFAQPAARLRRPPSRRAGVPRRSAGAVSRAAAMLALAVFMVGCGSGASTTPPVEVVQNYLDALAGGNYAGACALLDNRTRESPVRLVGRHVTCATVFARCLPHTVTSLKRDQTQLFYSTVQVNAAGRKATATVSGTAVARAIRQVTLAEERDNWKLTSYGNAVDRCQLMNPRLRHAGRSRRTRQG